MTDKIACDLCKYPAKYHLCQSHMDDMRFPDVHLVVENDLPENGVMVLWDDGEQTYIGGHDALGWFSTGDENETDRDEGEAIVWCELPNLMYLAHELEKFRKPKSPKPEEGKE